MIDFEQITQDLENINSTPWRRDREQISIPHAKEELLRGLKFFCRTENVKWLQGYDTVAEYLEDNRGKGLLLLGNYGVGKTVIVARIIPALLNGYLQRIVSVYTANDMNSKYETVLNNHLKVVDDIGTEGEYVVYGEHRMVFPELADKAERTGDLLFLTTNLSMVELEEKYGERTIERLQTTTQFIAIKGKSLRNK